MFGLISQIWGCHVSVINSGGVWQYDDGDRRAENLRELKKAGQMRWHNPAPQQAHLESQPLDRIQGQETRGGKPQGLAPQDPRKSKEALKAKRPPGADGDIDLDSRDFLELVKQNAEAQIYCGQSASKRKQPSSEERAEAGGACSSKGKGECASAAGSYSSVALPRAGVGEKEKRKKKDREREGERRLDREEKRTQEQGKTGVEEAYREEVRWRAVEIYWPFERTWFQGIVDRFNPKNGEHHVSYDDGDKLWYNLVDEERHSRLRWVGVPKLEKPGHRAKETTRNQAPERGIVAGPGRSPSTEADKPRKRARDQSDSDDTAGDLGGAGETESEGRAATPLAFGVDTLSREKTKRRKRVRETSGSDSDPASSTEGSSSREPGSSGSRRSSKGSGLGGTASDWKRSRDVICLDDSDEDGDVNPKP